MLRRLGTGVAWHRHLPSAARNFRQAVIVSDQSIKKGLDAVAETAHEEALESVLASRHAIVPALLAAGVCLDSLV